MASPMQEQQEQVEGERHPKESRIRQNYHRESEKGINEQIQLELYAFYTYLSMASYFERDDVALSGFADYFRKSSSEELEHAQKLMEFQNKRGGRVVFKGIRKPAKDDWGTGLQAMEAALELEKEVNKSLLDLHEVADRHNDYQMADFLETNYLTEQVEAIKEISGHITNLKRVGPGHGVYHFDKSSLS